MIRRSLLVVSLMGVLSSSALQAGKVGMEHNKYLDCLRRSNSANRLNVRKTLQDLVNQCHFRPGMRTNQFVGKYSKLVPKGILGRGEFSLMKALKPHNDRLNRTQLSFLSRLQSIVKSSSGADAIDQLMELEKEAQDTLGTSTEDYAVLHGLDIAVYSARYWVRHGAGSRRAKWWQIVLGDVAGGVVGGLFGGGVGAVGLGTACSKIIAEKG